VNTRRAFTLVEMLAATVLSALLMIGVLAVVRDLGAYRAAGAAAADSGAALTPEGSTSVEPDVLGVMAKLLRSDLGHAIAVETCERNELALIGYSALHAPGRGLTHRPVRIEYELAEIDGRRWLLRKQESLDVATNRNVQRDLVCCGLAGFELVRDLPGQPATDAKAAGPHAPDSGAPAADRDPEQGPETDDEARAASSPEPRWQAGIYEGAMAAYRERYGTVPPVLSPCDSPFWHHWLAFMQAYEKKMAALSHTRPDAGSQPRPDASEGSDDPHSPGSARAPVWEDDDFQFLGAGFDGGALWRLRIWTDEAGEPAADQVLTARAWEEP
jgi:hypothetical protein